MSTNEHAALIAALKFHPSASHVSPDFRDLFNKTLDQHVAALAATAPNAGVPTAEDAARWVEKRMHDFIREHGHTDPDTGALEFGRGAHAEEKEEYVGELEEIIAGMRSLMVCNAAPAGWSCSRAQGHSGPCAAAPAQQAGAPLPLAPSDEVARIVHLRTARDRRIYIAGPMTGLPDFNFPAFNAKAAELRAEGWHVENPAEHGHVEGADWVDYLRWDISRIATCGAVYLLPGWEASKGAALEVTIASTLGITFLGAAPQQALPMAPSGFVLMPIESTAAIEWAFRSADCSVADVYGRRNPMHPSAAFKARYAAMLAATPPQATLPASEAGGRYCNKCGYSGPDMQHQRPNGSGECHYLSTLTRAQPQAAAAEPVAKGGAS